MHDTPDPDDATGASSDFETDTQSHDDDERRPGGGPPGAGDAPTDRAGEDRRSGWRATRRGVLGSVAAAAFGSLLGGVASGSVVLDLPGSSSTLTEEWRQTFEDELVFGPILPPVPSADKVYVFEQGLDSFEGTLVALDRDTGSEEWSVDVSSASVALPTGFDPGGALFYGTVPAIGVVARDADTGDVLWDNATSLSVSDSYEAGMTAHYVPEDSTVYGVTEGPSIAALDESDGTERWTADSGESAFPLSTRSVEYGDSSLLLVNGVETDETGGSDGGVLTAFDRDAETDAWTVTRPEKPVTNLAVGDGTVYQAFGDLVDSTESDLFAYQVASSTVDWTETRTDVPWNFLQYVDSTLYAAGSTSVEAPTSDGFVAKFDGPGSYAWEYDAGERLEGFRVEEEHVFATTESGTVVALDDDDGTEDWSADVNAVGPLWTWEGALYTGTGDEPPKVSALDASDGAVLDSQALDGQTIGNLLLFDGRLWTSTHPDLSAGPGGTTGDSYVYELGLGGGGGNSPPTVDAGSDRTVDAGASVELDATASDPDGDSLSVSWSQTAGTSVSLSDADTETPAFTAPDVGSTTDLTFEVTADDGSATATDSVTITVEPTGSADPVDEADTDGDGDIDDGELRSAIVDWSSGRFSDSDLRDIIVEWSS